MFNTPFTQPQQIFSAWQSMMTGQSERLEELATQMKDAEQAAMTRAHEAIDEYAKLMKASLRYNQQIAEAWRNQFVEVSQTVTKAAEATVAQASETVATATTEA